MSGARKLTIFANCSNPASLILIVEGSILSFIVTVSMYIKVLITKPCITPKDYWFTCTPVLSCFPCTETTEWSRNCAWLTLRRLPIFTECKLWRKKFRVGGKWRGSVGFPEPRIFLGGLSFIPAEDINQIKLAFTYRGLKGHIQRIF